jgi:hypothetical protein
MFGVPPHRLCRLLGHTRKTNREGEYTDRRGRLRDRYRTRCTRCGSSDLGTIYERGLVEMPDWWMIQARLRGIPARVAGWWRTDCTVCRKPNIRFGRAVGRHEDCDEIPF